MDWITVANELGPYLQQGDLDHCIQRVTSILKGLPNSPYHVVLDMDFTNDPRSVAAYFDNFVASEWSYFDLAALYTETNGFSINPDRWYFDIFGYESYGGHEDYDWLAGWDVSASDSVTLTGMEKLQQVYQYHRDTEYFRILSYGGDPEVQQVRIAVDFCDLLIVLRFQNLIRRSVPFMEHVRVPILATSHEYDLIYETRPVEKNT
ncbi:MAG: hypothetical protein F9K46_01780 [Anaerolineae bacterium]|nr:MAG: hypothetical protein F9K46_01780 [Anaerolineae bacterium]